MFDQPSQQRTPRFQRNSRILLQEFFEGPRKSVHRLNGTLNFSIALRMTTFGTFKTFGAFETYKTFTHTPLWNSSLFDKYECEPVSWALRFLSGQRLKDRVSCSAVYLIVFKTVISVHPLPLWNPSSSEFIITIVIEWVERDVNVLNRTLRNCHREKTQKKDTHTPTTPKNQTRTRHHQTHATLSYTHTTPPHTRTLRSTFLHNQEITNRSNHLILSTQLTGRRAFRQDNPASMTDLAVSCR